MDERSDEHDNTQDTADDAAAKPDKVQDLAKAGRKDFDPNEEAE